MWNGDPVDDEDVKVVQKLELDDHSAQEPRDRAGGALPDFVVNMYQSIFVRARLLLHHPERSQHAQNHGPAAIALQLHFPLLERVWRRIGGGAEQLLRCMVTTVRPMDCLTSLAMFLYFVANCLFSSVPLQLRTALNRHCDALSLLTDHGSSYDTAQVAFRFVQENPQRHMQHPSYGHNPCVHTHTVVSTYRTRTYGDWQILVEQIQDGAHRSVLSLRACSRDDLAGLVLYAGPHRLAWLECHVSDPHHDGSEVVG